MRRSLLLFIAVGLAVAVGIGVFASPFADSDPDGLERVAQDEGFADRAREHDLNESPLADYGVEGVEDDGVSTALSGLIGVLVTFAIAVGVFALVRRSTRRPVDSDAHDPSPS